MNDGKTKKSQKHKNKTAFKIVFDTQALEKQKKVSLTNLCIRCTQQLQWKLQYNKYKKMTEPARCNFCQDKNVFRTYMKACQSCVVAKNVCAKCLEPDYEQPSEVKVLQKDQKQQDRVEHRNQIDFMKTLQQRSRRTIRRGLEKGKISWDNALEYFVDEEGKKMIGLHFRKGFAIDEDEDNQNSEDIMNENEDDDMFGDDDDESNDQDDEGKEKQEKKQKNKNNNDKKSKPQNDQEGQTKQEVEGKQNNQEGQKDEQENSDVEGDEVDCQNDLDFEDVDDEDLDQDEQEEEQQQKQKSKKPNNKK